MWLQCCLEQIVQGSKGKHVGKKVNDEYGVYFPSDKQTVAIYKYKDIVFCDW